MALERVETSRLLLRRCRLEDAEAMFSRYASDREVTRFLDWPTHRSLEDSRAFLALSGAEWQGRRAGPYLIESLHTGQLLGSTGLAFETLFRAATGAGGRQFFCMPCSRAIRRNCRLGIKFFIGTAASVSGGTDGPRE